MSTKTNKIFIYNYEDFFLYSWSQEDDDELVGIVSEDEELLFLSQATFTDLEWVLN